MATDLTKTVAKGAYADYSTANSADLTETAADTGNGNQFTASDNDLVIARNSGATEHTVTITSVNDPYGRTKNITAYALQAGEIAIFGPLKLTGWVQSTGKILVSANHAEIKFGIVQLPG